MHASVMNFLRRVIRPEEIEGLNVLEVGSQDVNGSPREVIEPYKPVRYVGVDFAPGKGVDVVLDVSNLVRFFGASTFDVVISTEMLEHAQDWRTAVNQMKQVLRTFGLLVITTRGPGFPFHGYPHDYWRYTIEHFKAIFSDMSILTLEPDVPTDPGVLMKAVKLRDCTEPDLSKIEVLPVSR